MSEKVRAQIAECPEYFSKVVREVRMESQSARFSGALKTLAGARRYPMLLAAFLAYKIFVLIVLVDGFVFNNAAGGGLR